MNSPRKIITDHKLFLLLEAQLTPNAPTDSDQPSGIENFEERLLNAFWLAFDNYIWEHAVLANLMNWFMVKPTGSPVFRYKMITYFCFALGKIESRMIASSKPENINHWVTKVINGYNCPLLKSRATDRNKMDEIENTLALALDTRHWLRRSSIQ